MPALCYCLLAVFLVTDVLAIEITTSKGAIFGKIVNVADPTFHGIADVFLGIPYAMPPVGNLRFKRPQERQPWNGVLNTTNYGPWCPQTEGPEKFVDEDCLYLNVFSPSANSGNAFPVMVYIHGGSMVEGSAAGFTAPGVVTNLVSRGVVVVTINYRLGPLACFTTMTEDAPANLGMLDQVMALRWVRDEIAHFGGDPNKVTLFGQSAGGCSVTFHTLSPMSRGLFHQAISHSGNSIVCLDGGFFPFHSNEPLAKRLCGVTQSQWNAKNFTGLLPCLRKLDWRAFNAVPGVITNWGPVVDGSGGFLPDWPRNLAKTRPNIPMISGTNKDEYYLAFLIAPQLKPANRSTYDILTNYFGILSEAEYGEYTHAVKKVTEYDYIVRPNPGPNDHYGWVKLIVKVLSDKRHHAHTLRDAQYWLESGNPQAYLYSFEYVSKAAPSLFYDETHSFVAHGSELYYLFMWLAGFNRTAMGTQDFAMIDNFGRWWTDFAKHGTPVLPGSAGPDWQPLTREKPDQYYRIAPQRGMMQDYHRTESVFWLETIPAITGSMGPTLPPPNPTTPHTSAASRLVTLPTVILFGSIVVWFIK